MIEQLGRAQHLSDRPGLEETVSGNFGWLRVQNLRDSVDASVVQLTPKRFQKPLAGCASVFARTAMNVEPRLGDP